MRKPPVSCLLVTLAILMTACGGSHGRSHNELQQRYQEKVLAAQTSHGTGQPAIWVIEDADTTITIFGTFHMLPDQRDWLTNTIRDAVLASDTIIFETDFFSQEGRDTLEQAFEKYSSRDQQDDAFQLLTEQERGDLSRIIQYLGLNEQEVLAQPPYLAAQEISTAHAMNGGYRFENGADVVLADLASKNGLQFGYMESSEWAVSLILSTNAQSQISSLVETIYTFDQYPHALELLVEKWMDGDVEGMFVLTGDVGSPLCYCDQQIYDALLLQRNQLWAKGIEQLLDEPGKYFVAVGAGHLVGDQSMLAMLSKEGIVVKRLN